MVEWNLTQQDPFSLIFASDYRLNKKQIECDSVWEIQLDGGENGGLSLYSTLSLRALSLRIFPVFSNQSETLVRLSSFYKPLSVLKITPNYTRIRVEPFEGVYTFLEYWFPENHSVIGKITVNNTSINEFDGAISLAIPLSPSDNGNKMNFAKTDSTNYLVGKTQNIFTLFIMGGAAYPGNYAQPSLENKILLKPGGQQQFNWVFRWDYSEAEAYVAAKNWLIKPWDAELSRIEILGQKECFEIETGDSQLDTILALSQNAALQMVVPDFVIENKPRLLMSRHPEKNYSFDESNKQTTSDTGVNPLQLWYFNQVSPGSFKISREILDSFFITQHEDGFISNFSEPGSGQTRFIAFPILATLTLELYEIESDKEWLQRMLPKLMNYLKFWFSVSQDHDQDGFPEWSHAIHSLYENLPIHDRWHTTGIGIFSRWIESPMLASLLINELKSALKIANLLNSQENKEWLEKRTIVLTEALQSMWNRKKKLFLYRDSVLHTSYSGIKLFKSNGSGTMKLNKKLRTIQRLVFHFTSEYEHTRRIHIYIHGKTTEGETIEEISTRQIRWSGKLGFATSSFAYSFIHEIEIINYSVNDKVEGFTADFSRIDITNLLPLWGEINSNQRMKYLVDNWVIKEFLQSFGLPLVPDKSQPQNSDLYNVVDLPLNTLIVLGLMNNGYREEAKAIWLNNVNAISKNLKLFRKFMKNYDASDGYGSGDYNIIDGMVPLSVFLKLAGIKKWSNSEIVLEFTNIFENPVNIRHRGITVHCNKSGHQIISPGSRIIETTGNGPHRIKLPR